MLEPQGLRAATDTPIHRQSSGGYPASRLPYAADGKPPSAAVVLAKLLAPAVLTVCLWSHVWLGVWAAMFACLSSVVVLAFAPRLLGTISGKVTWARDAGFGERIWLNRLLIPVPPDSSRLLTVLYLVGWTGTIVALWGAISALPVLSLSGLAVAYSAQFTCIAELVKLYRVMRDRHPLYRFWTSSPGNDNKHSNRSVALAGTERSGGA
jgi:hypothetical protein